MERLIVFIFYARSMTALSIDRIILPTVPHTGTNLVNSHILGKYKKIKNGRKVLFRHIDAQTLKFLVPFLEKYPAIVPLRHPRSCAVSWKAREKSVFDMLDCWKILIESIDQYNPFYLPIDRPSSGAFGSNQPAEKLGFNSSPKLQARISLS